MIIKYKRGNEFLGHALKKNLIENKYRINFKCATAENSPENTILKRIHQVIANLIPTFDLQKRTPRQG